MSGNAVGGDDTLVSGNGNEIMAGDALFIFGLNVTTGEDTFVFDVRDDFSFGNDTIVDFEDDKDELAFIDSTDLLFDFSDLEALVSGVSNDSIFPNLR